MPQWQPTLAAVSKGGRRGGPPATDAVPVLVTAARTADVPVYLDGVGTAKALNTVNVSLAGRRQPPQHIVHGRAGPGRERAVKGQSESVAFSMKASNKKV